jgi:hypothetical protein
MANASCIGINTQTPFKRLTIDASEVSSDGIAVRGNSSPAYILCETSGVGSTFTNDSAAGYIGTITNHPFNVRSNSQNRLTFSSTGIACFACQVCAPSLISSGTICSTGNTCFGGTSIITGCLGVGATPTQRLTVAGNVLLNGASTSLNFNTPASGNGDISFDGNALAVVSNSSSACLLLSTNSTARLQITNTGIACFACSVTATGNVTISSTANASLVAATNSTTGFTFIDLINNGTSGRNYQIGIGGNSAASGYANNLYFDLVGVGNIMTLTCGRNVGIGTQSPNRLTEIAASSGAVLGIANNNESGGSGILYGRIAMYSTAGSNTYIDYGGEIRSYSGPGVDYSDLRFYTAFGATSTERMRITNAGIACFACQVCAGGSLITNGIIDVNSNSVITNINDKFSLGVNSTCYAWMQSYGGRPLYMNALGNNILLPNNTTRLGIGTCTPSAKLHIDMGSISSDTNTIHLSSTDASGTNKWGIVWYSGTGADFRGKVMADNNGKLYLDSVGGGGIILNCNGGSGNVGIGNTSPLAKLDILGNTDTYAGMAKIYLTDSNTNSNSRNWSIGNGGSAYGNLTFSVSAAKNGNAGDGTSINAMVINNTGNVGIGTPSPASLFHTSGTSNIFKHFTTANNGTWIEFQANSTAATRPFYVGQDNSGGGSFGVGAYAGVIFTSSGDPVVIATGSTARLTVTGAGIACFACQVCAPSFRTNGGFYGCIFQGASFSSLTGGAGTGNAIFDTVTRSDAALYEVSIVANPNGAGSGAYADFYYGDLLIGTGFDGSVKNFIFWCQRSTPPRSLYGSGGGNLTVNACMFYSGTENSSIGVGGTYTIRFKINGYNSSVTGDNTTIFLKQII